MQANARPARVLALSSQVAFGHVGLSAAVPVLQRLGVAVTPLPSVILSNHAAWPHVAAHPMPVADLRAAIDALEANGWLGQHDTLLTGYLPSADHVVLAAELADRMRELVPDLKVIVDPILGDAPKGLYVAESAAGKMGELLVSRADVITPNLFELSWLSGFPVETLDQAMEAAHALGGRILTTSVPVTPSVTGIMESRDGVNWLVETPRLEAVPNGVGDVFSALIAGGCELGQAMGHLQGLIGESLGAEHLRIVESASDWSRAAPVTKRRVENGNP